MFVACNPPHTGAKTLHGDANHSSGKIALVTKSGDKLIFLDSSGKQWWYILFLMCGGRVNKELSERSARREGRSWPKMVSVGSGISFGAATQTRSIMRSRGTGSGVSSSSIETNGALINDVFCGGRVYGSGVEDLLVGFEVDGFARRLASLRRNVWRDSPSD